MDVFFFFGLVLNRFIPPCFLFMDVSVDDVLRVFPK